MKIAFVFPGQGSQAVGMLDAWSDVAAVTDTVAQASQALGQDLGALIAQGPVEQLNLTTNTQPAMLTASVAFFAAWRAAGGRMPDVVAGHSLGEYAALTAAGSLALEDAVRLVRVRADAMQAAVPVGTGAMAAILGLDDDAVRAACASAAQGEVVEAVNFNAPAQVVIAGHKAAVERACELAKAAGAKRALLLPVSAPFHSSLLKPAADVLARAGRGGGVCAPGARHQQRRCRVAGRTRGNPGCAGTSGMASCALGGNAARHEGPGRDPRHRMRSRQGAGRPDQAHRSRAYRPGHHGSGFA